MKLLVSHITGNANVKAALDGFLSACFLHEFHVSMATFHSNILGKLSAYPAFSELTRRQFNDVLQPKTKMWPWLEAGRLLLLKIKLASLVNDSRSIFHIDAVCRNFDRHVAASIKSNYGKIDAFYGYEDLSEFSFLQAKQQNIKCFYDLPIGYWKAGEQLMLSEKERRPGYFKTITGFSQTEAKLQRKEEELRMADKIFVASTFTANTLKSYKKRLAPVVVVPYGFPPVLNIERDYTYHKTKRRLKLLFVGSLSQRKGIAELFDAVNKLHNHVELTIVGTKTVDDCTELNNEVVKHTWIPSLSHQKILELMRQTDVLVFPSLFEGFGLVITEAMSQGTPVITTNRTAGPDIIESDKNGWLIDAASTESLVRAIEKIICQPELVALNGIQARAKAANRPWQQYGIDLAQAVACKQEKNEAYSIKYDFTNTTR